MNFDEQLKEKIRKQLLTKEKNLDFERKRLDEQVEYNYNRVINCGGYALEVELRFFQYSHDFEKAISELLNRVPFIRLLGDKPLEDDEYIVMYRWNKGGGHHFVKVQEDGTIMEKDDCKPVRKFKRWSKKLENAPEAVFAVKKEHEMKLEWSGTIKRNEGMNFQETVQDALSTQKESFEYHNHSYCLKNNDEGNVDIYSNVRVVAKALIDNGKYIVNVLPEAEKYVSNTQPDVPLCIKAGKVQKNEINR